MSLITQIKKVLMNLRKIKIIDCLPNTQGQNSDTKQF